MSLPRGLSCLVVSRLKRLCLSLCLSVFGVPWLSQIDAPNQPPACAVSFLVVFGRGKRCYTPSLHGCAATLPGLLRLFR
ncbi:hypothetical protein JB92DRAFT_2956303, partial [Gautieria morchelliformis]